jgi:hypothetical protein
MTLVENVITQQLEAILFQELCNTEIVLNQNCDSHVYHINNCNITLRIKIYYYLL